MLTPLFRWYIYKKFGAYGGIKLVSKELFAIADVNAIGAMGQNAPSPVTTVKLQLTRSEARGLARQGVLKIRKETHFYFGDRFNNFKIANRKSLIDFFPGKSRMKKIMRTLNFLASTLQVFYAHPFFFWCDGIVYHAKIITFWVCIFTILSAQI